MGRKGDLGFAGLRVDGKVPSRELALVLSPLAGATGTWSWRTWRPMESGFYFIVNEILRAK